MPGLGFRSLWGWLNLKITRGGTSFFSLMLIGAICIALSALSLSFSGVTFHDKPCKPDSIQLLPIVEQLTRATSLFLGVGYTAFKPSNPHETIGLTTVSALGLIWYALLIPVLVRRIYR